MMIKWITLIAALTIASPALALKVANCDAQPHSLTLDYYGETTTRIIQPNEHVRFYGRAREILLNDRTYTLIRHHDEYCIRKGVLTLQRRAHDTRGFR